MGFVSKLFSSPEGRKVIESAPPKVSAEPAGNADALKRVGRAALIATSAQGVLGNPTTGRKQLLS